jgi:agmatine deiminase
VKENSSPSELGYRMPAEWEPHEATWLSWPKDPVTWPDRVPQVQEIFAQMIEALTAYERVNLLVDDDRAEQEVRQKLVQKQVRWNNLFFYHLKTVDSWIRDYGPNFLVGTHGPAPLLAFNDWIFNAWGDKYEALKADDTIPQQLAPLLQIPHFEPGIVLEGGSIEVNGRGTLLTTEQCLLNKNRNPYLSQEEIEGYVKNYLGVNHILWLGEGIAGDDTDGHVDDITRFVSADTVVTVIEEDPKDENYKPLKDNLKRLHSMRDQEGRPLKIVTLPMPGLVYSDEGRLPASYANFYIANGVVLVPVYQLPNDEQALSILQKLFPDRRVVGIPCVDLVVGLGAIHCVTQQQPAIPQP